jgi:hypothetical protein
MACAACGVTWDTAKHWIIPSSAQAKKEPYATFRVRLEQAKAAWAYAAIMRINRAGKRGDWRADLALLERRFPHYFSLQARQRQAIAGSPLSLLDPMEQLSIAAGLAPEHAFPGSTPQALPDARGSEPADSYDTVATDGDDVEHMVDDMDGRSTEELEHYAATGYWPEEMPRMDGRVVDTDGQDVTEGDAADPATAAELAKQLGDADAADPYVAANGHDPCDDGKWDPPGSGAPFMPKEVAQRILRELPGGQLVEDAPARDEPAQPSNVVRLPRYDPLAGRF